MTIKDFEKTYLGKNVEIILYGDIKVSGCLEKGDTKYYTKYGGWFGKGYHIGYLTFRKSHVKSIKIV